MQVNRLLKKAHLTQVSFNHRISKICSDSRKCVENSVFVALDRGICFVDQAIAHGAKTIIAEQQMVKRSDINYLIVTSCRKTLAEICRIYYSDVKSLKLIGFLGTNGKTTTSTIAYRFFNSIGKKSMLIGSNGVFYESNRFPLENTTPDLLTIYEYLTEAISKHIRYVMMEVSSVAVDQLRIGGLEFSVLFFTNFSEDHLDYHQTMESYFFCKMIPFLQLSRRATAILNTDDISVLKLYPHLRCRVLEYGFTTAGDFCGSDIESNENGIHYRIKGYEVSSFLFGKFNCYNTLAIFGLCEVFHIPYPVYIEFLKQFREVPGRMNLICEHHRTIFIDYAHTEQAVTQAIETVASFCRSTLWIVLGCGGNREKEKRYAIGKRLNDVSGKVILTTDNPRYENPSDILKDIQKEMTRDVVVILNREEAIRYALDQMKEEDVLLILGKGCEDYMDIRGVKFPYSDKEVVHDWLVHH